MSGSAANISLHWLLFPPEELNLFQSMKQVELSILHVLLGLRNCLALQGKGPGYSDASREEPDPPLILGNLSRRCSAVNRSRQLASLASAARHSSGFGTFFIYLFILQPKASLYLHLDGLLRGATASHTSLPRPEMRQQQFLLTITNIQTRHDEFLLIDGSLYFVKVGLKKT